MEGERKERGVTLVSPPADAGVTVCRGCSAPDLLRTLSLNANP